MGSRAGGITSLESEKPRKTNQKSVVDIQHEPRRMTRLIRLLTNPTTEKRILKRQKDQKEKATSLSNKDRGGGALCYERNERNSKKCNW